MREGTLRTVPNTGGSAPLPPKSAPADFLVPRQLRPIKISAAGYWTDDVLFPRVGRPLAQSARRCARAARGRDAVRSDRVEPDARVDPVRPRRDPLGSRPAGVARLRARPVRARLGARGRGAGRLLPRTAGRPGPRPADGEHQRSLRLPLQAPLRSRRRSAGAAPELPALRAPRAARIGHRRPLPPRIRRRVARRLAVGPGRSDASHARHRDGESEQPDRLVPEELRARRPRRRSTCPS